MEEGMDDVEVRRLITATLQAAGVGNVQTIESPAPDSTCWCVLLEDSSTTIAAVQALKTLPGICRIRRAQYRSHVLVFQVVQPVP
jgi:hypothetical protein